MTTPTIIVAGLGRCGTTMLMRMLDAAGMPTIGEAPDWEDMGNTELCERDPKAWGDTVQGRAVKLLDAHRFNLPDLSGAKLIWLARNPNEQAKSMLKLVGFMFSTVTIDRRSVRAMKKSICRDTTAAVRALDKAVGSGVGIALTFEDILKDPAGAAKVLCEYLDLPTAATEAMAAQVTPRSAACLPYLAEFSA
ncbi:sulfotransferase [Novosphingobium sp. PY1]|uniref:Sulfotransferase family protein n=1 Tax=Ochrobactrum sp. PW1 TaxID=1882222 RepID=A0A292GSB3_9HYPH|nr:sulfotransferase [Novosphingobium sp. PY1]BBA74379.1 hypothetical protein [Ochrobactrum sp. PW1]GFM29228.1 putative uncharacterized protein [Novosphingobium sp. PY1]